MSDDKCGAECVDGSTCQNPAGSCPVDSHTDTNRGRPSKYSEERVNDILSAAQRGTTIEGCARAAGIHHSTLYDWLDAKPEFSEAFNRARAKGEQRLVDAVEEKDPKFLLERSYEYHKTEKREVDLEGSLSGEGFTVVMEDE